MLDIKEIISKNTLETSEIIFVVQEYIKEKKDRDVDINLLKGLNLNNPFFQVLYSQQLNKLNLAYDVSAKFFHEKLRSK